MKMSSWTIYVVGFFSYYGEVPTTLVICLNISSLMTYLSTTNEILSKRSLSILCNMCNSKNKRNTVEAWYEGRNGTFESVPLHQAVPYIRLWLFCCLCQPNITRYTPIKALLHCKLSMWPPYTIRTKILLCNWQNFNYFWHIPYKKW